MFIPVEVNCSYHCEQQDIVLPPPPRHTHTHSQPHSNNAACVCVCRCNDKAAAMLLNL